MLTSLEICAGAGGQALGLEQAGFHHLGLIEIDADYWSYFDWPLPDRSVAPTVGEALYSLMAANGWEGAEAWREQANSIAPTLVGGSKKHGGADLGPTRARKAWLGMGVDGRSLADAPPELGFEGVPKLTLGMTALVQGFPESWAFQGKKTAAYRQIGNAFPPPVAKAVGAQIKSALNREHKKKRSVGLELEIVFPDQSYE